jgi:glycosyltransferase involved in cell wall biosynthesis
MRILFIVPYVPNLIRVRPYNLIRHLAAHGHEVTVLTLWSNQGERADAEALKQYCHRVVALSLPRWRSLWNCLRALPGTTPLQAVYCWLPSLARRLDFEIRNSQFEIAHVEHLRGARYGLYLKSAIRNPQSAIPVVWDSVDCISLLFEQALQMGANLGSRLRAGLDLARTRRYEGWLVSQFDRVLVTSEVDRQALQDLVSRSTFQVSRFTDHVSRFTPNPQSAITVLPNGVDLDYFQPLDVPKDSATLVITGKMSYHANVAAAIYLGRDIMPRVWAQRPEVKLYIVGKDPPEEIRAMAKEPRITVTDYVPDMRPYLTRATVAVAPLVYGVGTQYKILEAMAMSTPVVATSVSGRGLGVVDGENILIAKEPEGFAQLVLELLRDEGLRERIGRNGRKYVEEHHDWRGVAERLEEIYQGVLERRKWTA